MEESDESSIRGAGGSEVWTQTGRRSSVPVAASVALGKQEVWPPGSADTVCPRRPLMTGTALNQYSSDWSRDIATLTFDLGGHDTCGWCGSSSNKFEFRRPCRSEDLAHDVCQHYGPRDLDLWPFDLETGMQVASKVGNLLPNLGTLGLWVLQLFDQLYSPKGRHNNKIKKNRKIYKITNLTRYYTTYNKAQLILIRSNFIHESNATLFIINNHGL